MCFGVAIVSSLATPSVALAQKSGRNAPQAPPATSAPAPEAPAPSEKLDVTDLEQKYWAAKDTDFSVVQNRLFSKAGRFALTPQYGIFINEPWSEGATVGFSGTYYFSERYGLELAYTNTQSQDTEAVTRLKAKQGGVPNHNKVKGFYGAAFNWVPFYAKMSVLNSKITYFDMSFSPGVGIVEYEQQIDTGGVRKTAPALTFDVTQTFFLSNWFAIRVELKNRWFMEELSSYDPDSTITNVYQKWDERNQTSLVMVGGTFYFGGGVNP